MFATRGTREHASGATTRPSKGENQPTVQQVVSLSAYSLQEKINSAFLVF